MKLPFFLARKFVAAETLEGALPIVRSIKAEGLSTTIDKLGEYVSDLSVATEAKEEYITLIRTLNEATGRIDQNISIKLSMLGQKIDEAFCIDNLHEVLTEAKQTGTFVRLDMEGTDITESTLSIFEKVYPDYRDHVGVVLQAYLKRTKEDIDRMCELQARVRLCKGAYSEPASVAWQDMPTIRDRFLEYMETLITKGRFPGIATHDDLLINATKAFVAERGISKDRFEFQMLYGLRSDTQRDIAGEGYG
ncbi:MAG: proline dehydrogenase family protein, partial [Rhodothermales bacterium]